MKQFLKVFLIVFLICCIILGILILRNYLILNKAHKLQMDMLSKLENSNNFMYEEFSETPSLLNASIKIYCKDGIYRKVETIGDEVPNIEYLNTNEPSEISKEDFLHPITLVSLVLARDESFKPILIRNLLKFVKVQGDYYILTIEEKNPPLKGTNCYYINKETGIIEKWEFCGNTTTYKITENVVTDEDIRTIENA